MESQCQYPSRRCYNTRSVKISGELHRFCIFHRWRANAAQRRWTLKRQREGESSVSDSACSPQAAPAKRRRSQKQPKLAPKPTSKERSKSSICKPAPLTPSSPVVKWETSLDLQMSDEDIVILQSILLDADDEQPWDQSGFRAIQVMPWWEADFHPISTTSGSRGFTV